MGATDEDFGFLERAGVDLLLPMWDDGVAPQFGWQEEQRWDEFASWMIEQGLIDPSTDYRTAFTNEFIEARRRVRFYVT